MHYLVMLNLSRGRFKLGCKGGDKQENGNDTKNLFLFQGKIVLTKKWRKHLFNHVDFNFDSDWK